MEWRQGTVQQVRIQQDSEVRCGAVLVPGRFQHAQGVQGDGYHQAVGPGGAAPVQIDVGEILPRGVCHRVRLPPVPATWGDVDFCNPLIRCLLVLRLVPFQAAVVTRGVGVVCAPAGAVLVPEKVIVLVLVLLVILVVLAVLVVLVVLGLLVPAVVEVLEAEAVPKRCSSEQW